MDIALQTHSHVTQTSIPHKFRIKISYKYSVFPKWNIQYLFHKVTLVTINWQRPERGFGEEGGRHGHKTRKHWKTLVKGAITLTSLWQHSKAEHPSYALLLQVSAKLRWEHGDKQLYWVKRFSFPFGSGEVLVREGGKGQLLLPASPFLRHAPLLALTIVVPGVLQHLTECRAAPATALPVCENWARPPEALGIPPLCSWLTWVASLPPEKAPPCMTQPLTGVLIFTACAFCCRSLLGKTCSGLVGVLLLQYASRVGVQMQPLWQRGTALLSSAGLLQTWHFLQKMCQSWVICGF